MFSFVDAMQQHVGASIDQVDTMPVRGPMKTLPYNRDTIIYSPTLDTGAFYSPALGTGVYAPTIDTGLAYTPTIGTGIVSPGINENVLVGAVPMDRSVTVSAAQSTVVTENFFEKNMYMILFVLVVAAGLYFALNKSQPQYSPVLYQVPRRI